MVPGSFTKLKDDFDLDDITVSKAFLNLKAVSSETFIRSFQFKFLDDIIYTKIDYVRSHSLGVLSTPLPPTPLPIRPGAELSIYYYFLLLTLNNAQYMPLKNSLAEAFSNNFFKLIKFKQCKS